MSIIDKVTQHFDSIEKRSIEVPEWDVTVYCTPLTLAEKDMIFKRAKKSDSDFAFNAYAVVMKSVDENGTKLFDMADATKLMAHADADVVARVGEFIFDFEPKN